MCLELGAKLTDIRVAYRTWGELNRKRDNAVVVCHAMTQTPDVDQWWPDMLGAGQALDPERDFIICSNILGSCFGTTGPASIDPRTKRPYGPTFPTITVRDMVALQIWLARELGVRRVGLVIGAGLGAMQALEWVVMAPELVDSFVAVAACGRQSAWCIAFSEAQRCVIFADPLFKGGAYAPDQPPKAGLAIARMIAKCTYRSRASFERRYGRKVEPNQGFAVESFLRDDGMRLAERFDANSYMTLTRAMDFHDLARGRGTYEAVLATVKTPGLLVSIPSDMLHPTEEQAELVAGLTHARMVQLRSVHGNDAFLTDVKQLAGLVNEFRHKLAD